MAIIKAVSSRASIGNAINYVTRAEKTEQKLITGQDCNPYTAIDEMKATKDLWHKTDGRQYKHFVQSFSPDEKITPEQAHKIACDLVKDQFKGHEVLITTHKDKDHIHSHFIVNSVNYENGQKLQWSKQDLTQMKERSDSLCRANQLSVCEKGKEISIYNLDKYKTMEKAIRGNYKSYVIDTAQAVNKAKTTAKDKGEFLDLMKQQGYEVEWNDRKKYITFKDKEGNKVRNSNLTKTFKEDYGKESLENEFKRNEQQRTDRGTEGREKGENQQRINRAGERGAEASSGELYKRLDEIQGIGERYSKPERDSASTELGRDDERQRQSKERDRERSREIER